mmetsp:Transcript_20551/g.44913  ORF Transcript_20551/g.44913 Transcript_20551/m.44913 type:complete len:670 (-) Transcript_20551:105-2114(-)
MLGRRRAWRRSRGMCSTILWTKLHKRRRIVRSTTSKAATRSSPLQSETQEFMVDDDGAPSPVALQPCVDQVDAELPQCPAPSTASASTTASTPQKETSVGEQAVPAVEKPKRQVILLPSVFEGRPPVLLFTYTVACGAKQRSMDRAVYADIDGPKLFYSHTDEVHEYNATINIVRQGGLYRVKADSQRYMLLWSRHPSPEVLRCLKPSQKTNHYPGSWNLGHKDLLWRNISRMYRRFGQPYEITPTGFNLPKASVSFEVARHRQPAALWIWKPCSQSCGRGIRVFSSSVSKEEAAEFTRKRGVVQRYVPNPLLIDGFKFDLRIYVLVVSYDPLKVYINDEGLVRLATEKYSESPDTLDSKTMHLTNYSVNKESPAFVQNRDGRDSVGVTGDDDAGSHREFKEETQQASKWSLSELRTNFEQRGLKYEVMLDRIKDVIIKTLIAVEPALRADWAKALGQDSAGWAARGAAGAHVSSTASCFELYGFDILVDRDLKPWLLEVNICPSLSSGSPLDKRIKTKLVADTLTLVGLQPPPNIWRRSRGSMKRPCSDVDEEEDRLRRLELSQEERAKRAVPLRECDNPADALAHFDELAWEAVLQSQDEDMRSGGFTRIFPTADSAKYVPYMGKESYLNLVLRKWYEAGGSDLFTKARDGLPFPPWVPRQLCFSTT